MQELRDYLYLDLKRLEDYLSILEPTGEVRQLSETIHNERVQAASMPKLGEPADEGDSRPAEVIIERTMSVSAKHAFNRLYEKLSDSMIDIDEKPGEVTRGSAVKVTRDFELSPVGQMIESLPEAMRMSVSSESELDEKEEEMAALVVNRLLKGSDTQHDIPIIAKASSPSYSVVFLADPQYMLRGPDEMAGDMTLVGKVRRVIPDNQELNLLTLPNVLPRGIRQSGLEDDDIAELFTELDSDALTIKGPAIIVDVLAVFT